jgi:phage baseplate assembly protein W
MPGVRQRMILALGTIRGSSTSLPDLGVALPDKMDRRFETRVRQAVREAARQLTEVERVAVITSIEVTRGARRAAIHVTYVDLTTSQIEDLVV